MDKITLSILLVDDSRGDYIITRELLSEIRETNYVLDWKSSYEEGLEAIRQNTHDLYLFDYNLGGAQSGLDLLHEAVAGGCKAPVILLTGQGDHNLDIDAMKGGAAFFLEKGHMQTEPLERIIRYALEQKRNEQQKLVRAYFYDKTTGLSNIFLFKEHLAQAIAQAERYGRQIAVLYFDIDNFRRINDTLSYSVGDRLLKALAERLSTLTRKSDLVSFDSSEAGATEIARMGNDEFTILLIEIKAENAARVAKRILDSFSEPFLLEKQEVYITGSIGISTYPNDGNTVSTLLNCSERALRHAKQLGKNQYQFYEKTMNTASMKKLLLENLLHKALKRGELSLYYQPQIDITTGRIAGFEALVRWIHPDMGIISPNEFIPIAEECGLIIPIGEWIVKSACAQLDSWIRSGYEPLRVSINLSKYQFNQINLIEYIVRVLKEVKISPEYLELEITETTVMHNEKKTISMLHDLKEMGIRLSMDDFGTGYSSLHYLRQFPIDTLKIDRSFITDIPRNQDNFAIVQTIIQLARNLHLSVIAEGVETEEQLIALSGLKCGVVQGFLFAQPLPSGQAEQIMRSRKSGIYKEFFSSLSMETKRVLDWPCFDL